MVQAPRLSEKIYRISFLLLILLLVFIAYWPSLHNDFVNWDDDVHFLENKMVRTLDWPHVKEIFTTTVNGCYVPLSELSFALEYNSSGYDPFVYHLDNLLLHILVTTLVIALASRLGLSVFASGMAGLIFGIHPLHVESVAWVTERKDVLNAIFYLLSILAYLKYLDFRQPCFLLMSVALGVLSILAKPMALSLPVILFVCDWFYTGKITRRDILNKVYYLAFLVPIAWITYSALAGIVKIHSLNGFLVWIWCFIFYIGKFIFPGETMLCYPLPFPVSFDSPAYVLSCVIFALLGVCLWIGRRNRALIFAFLFYLGSIFFLLRVNVILCSVADHFMYLPSIGFCMLAALATERLWKYSKKNILLFCGIFVALVLILSATVMKTRERTLIWRDSISLWNNQLRVNPTTGRGIAYCKLADAYAADPHVIQAIGRLAGPYSDQNPELMKQDRATVKNVLNIYGLAIAAKFNYADSYFGMANIYKNVGDTDNAAYFYQSAVRYDPKHFQSLFELARISQAKGLFQEAIAYDRRAIEANPLNSDLYQNILLAYEGSIGANNFADIYGEEKKRVTELGRGVINE